VKFAAWAEINLDALEGNLDTILRLAGGGRKVILVVKADGYGHGGVQVARVAQQKGVAMLGVATLYEGIELRNAGITLPILILGPSLNEEVADIVSYGLRPTVCDQGFARRFGAACLEQGKDLPVHVEVDTGMGRTGIDYENAESFIEELVTIPGVSIEGLFTHFPDCTSEDVRFSKEQLDRFGRLVERLEAAGIKIAIKHAANSAGVISLPESHLDAVRPGLMAFGLLPAGTSSGMDLRPVMTLKSRIIQLRRFERGRSVGYGRSYTTGRKALLAAVPIGYGHGYSWRLSNNGVVLVGGKRVPIVGQVSMDITMVDVSSVEGVKVGEEVVLFGEQGAERITVDEIAAATGTINYEVLCGIGRRVVRVFKRNGRAEGIVTMLGQRSGSLKPSQGRAGAFSPGSGELLGHTLEGGRK